MLGSFGSTTENGSLCWANLPKTPGVEESLHVWIVGSVPPSWRTYVFDVTRTSVTPIVKPDAAAIPLGSANDATTPATARQARILRIPSSPPQDMRGTAPTDHELYHDGVRRGNQPSGHIW